MVPFVDGWETTPIWAGGEAGKPEPFFNLYFKGENLTKEYISNLDMYSVKVGFRTDISVMLVNETADGFVAEILSEEPVVEYDRYQLVIGETVSGDMLFEGGKLV